MKKMFLYAVAATMTLGMSLTSCNKDEVKVEAGTTNGGADIVNKDVEPANTVWPVADQKSYLDEVGQKFQRKVDLSALEEYSRMMREFQQVVSESKTDPIADWVSDTMDELTDWNGGSKMTFTIGLSSLKGHWYLSSYGYWNMNESNSLEVTANLKDGSTCTMSVTPSGSTKKVHMTEQEDEEMDMELDGYLEVPEHIKVVFSKGSAKLVTYDLDIELSLSGDEFYPSKSGIGVSGTVTYSNGYKILIDRVAYSKSAYGAKATLVVDGESVLVFRSGANIQNLPSGAISGVMGDDMDLDIDEMPNVTDFTSSVDILGLVQMKMGVTDVAKFQALVEESEECNYNESSFKKCVERMQPLFQGYVYFNGGTAKQAELKPVAKWDRYEGIWTPSIAVYLEDGTIVDVDSYMGDTVFMSFYEMLSGIALSF